MIDYKFTHISHPNDGSTKWEVRVYEGAVTAEVEELDGVVGPVTRYRRARVLDTLAFTEKPGVSEQSIRGRMNRLLKARYPGQTAIPEQVDA